MKDKFTGQPRGMAYIQFADEKSVKMAQSFDQTNFNGRPITVSPKFKPGQMANPVVPALPRYPAAPVNRGSYNRVWINPNSQKG